MADSIIWHLAVTGSLIFFWYDNRKYRKNMEMLTQWMNSVESRFNTTKDCVLELYQRTGQ